jgi:hypothetical protein
VSTEDEAYFLDIIFSIFDAGGRDFSSSLTIYFFYFANQKK